MKAPTYRPGINKIQFGLILSILLCFCCLFITGSRAAADDDRRMDSPVITDCNFTFAQATSGKEIPKGILQSLEIVNVEYYSFDGKLHRGQIVVHKDLAMEIAQIFEDIKDSGFPVAKVIPVSRYNWSDEESMKDNNTSGFNYRSVKGTGKLSSHARGRAIDINPLQNPQIKKGIYSPPGAQYRIKEKGTLTLNSEIVSAFRKRGWKWGGLWRSSKDYQHFEKL